MKRDTRPPTAAQIDYARQLINDTGNDPEWYCVERMTRGQVARLIDKLLDELERGEKERRYIAGLIDKLQDEKGRADDGRGVSGISTI